MMRKKSVKTALAVSAIAVLGVTGSVCAQDEEAAPEARQEDKSAADVLKPVDTKVFSSLFKCRLVDGTVEIRKQGEDTWVKAKEGHYYPLGSSIRTMSELGAPVRVEISFGTDCILWTTNVAEIATRPIEIGENTRTVELKSGRINLNLPRVLKNGLFFVAAPYFTCSNLAGESWFDYKPTGDGDEAVVHCKTGLITLTGRHYKIERMGAAYQVRIRSTADDLFSWIRGESGANKILLDQGMIAEKNFETGETKDVPKTLEFPLAPKNAVKIFRRRSPVSGNMIVSMMTFDAAGVIQNRCAFAEGRSNVNSGELVAKPLPVVDADAVAKATAGDGAAAEKPAKKANADDAAPAEEPAPAPAKEEKPAADNGDSDI